MLLPGVFAPSQHPPVTNTLMRNILEMLQEYELQMESAPAEEEACVFQCILLCCACSVHLRVCGFLLCPRLVYAQHCNNKSTPCIDLSHGAHEIRCQLSRYLQTHDLQRSTS